MAEAYFLGTDFDGTTHLTSEPTPDGMTVDRAYEVAIDAHLDIAAVDIFRLEQHGHSHRDPGEIVDSLMPDADDIERSRVTRLVVATKLAVLEPSIGKYMPDGEPWPRLTTGFRQLWEAISAAKKEDHIVGTAIISAGHTDFQKKAFAVHELEYPDAFMTFDVLRAINSSMSRDWQVKPSPLMYKLALVTWAYGQGLDTQYGDTINAVMAGDSPEKDGGVAAALDIPFFQVDPDSSRQTWHDVGQSLGLPKIVLDGILASE